MIEKEKKHIIIPRPRNELSLVSYTYRGTEGGMGEEKRERREI